MAASAHCLQMKGHWLSADLKVSAHQVARSALTIPLSYCAPSRKSSFWGLSLPPSLLVNKRLPQSTAHRRALPRARIDPELLPSLDMVKLEGLIFLYTFVSKLVDVVSSLPRSMYKKDPSLAVAKAVVISERELLGSGADVKDWVGGLTERVGGVAGVGGVFGEAVQEGLEQAIAEAERPGQKVLLQEEFRALAVSELEEAEQALNGVQFASDNKDVQAASVPLSILPATVDELFRTDDVLSVQRIMVSLEPVVTANKKYLEELLMAARVVYSCASQPSLSHGNVLKLLSKARAGGGPLKAAIDLELELDLHPDEQGVTVLLNKDEYREAMETTTAGLISHLQQMLGQMSSKNVERAAGDTAHQEDWATWARTGSHKVPYGKGAQKGINISEMAVKYLPFSKEVPVFLSSTNTWEKDEDGVPLTLFPQGLKGSSDTIQGVAIVDIPYAEYHGHDLGAASIVRFVPLTLEDWLSLYRECSLASSDPGLAVSPGFGMNPASQIRMGAWLKIGLNLTSTAPVVLLQWPSKGRLDPASWSEDKEDAMRLAAYNLQMILEHLCLVIPEGKAVNVLSHSLGGSYSTNVLINLKLPPPAKTSSLGVWIQAASTAKAGALEDSLKAFNKRRFAVGDQALKCVRYICRKDRAFLAAKLAEGSSRLKDGEDLGVSCESYTTVDCSEVGGADLHKHSYITQSSAVLYDVGNVLRGVEGPNRAPLDSYENAFKILPRQQ